MYYSRYCQYFYIGLLLSCGILIVTTIVDGFKIADSPFFIAVELLLNVTITIDFAARVRMAGFKPYLKKSLWNKLDFLIVVGCDFLFMFSIIFRAAAGEISEELLLTFWAVGQSLRMIVIARKRRQAIRSAKTLIDFSNIGVIETLGVHEKQ